MKSKEPTKKEIDDLTHHIFSKEFLTLLKVVPKSENKKVTELTDKLFKILDDQMVGHSLMALTIAIETILLDNKEGFNFFCQSGCFKYPKEEKTDKYIR